MRIIRLDEDTKVERTIANGLTNEEAKDRAIDLAIEERRRLPNNPKIVGSGPNAISVAMGVYKITTYRIEP